MYRIIESFRLEKTNKAVQLPPIFLTGHVPQRHIHMYLEHLQGMITPPPPWTDCANALPLFLRIVKYRLTPKNTLKVWTIFCLGEKKISYPLHFISQVEEKLMGFHKVLQLLIYWSVYK